MIYDFNYEKIWYKMAYCKFLNLMTRWSGMFICHELNNITDMSLHLFLQYISLWYEYDSTNLLLKKADVLTFNWHCYTMVTFPLHIEYCWRISQDNQAHRSHPFWNHTAESKFIWTLNCDIQYCLIMVVLTFYLTIFHVLWRRHHSVTTLTLKKTWIKRRKVCIFFKTKVIYTLCWSICSFTHWLISEVLRM